MITRTPLAVFYCKSQFVNHVVFSHDGNLVVAAGNTSEVRAFDTKLMHQVKKLRVDSDSVFHGVEWVAFTPDDKEIVARTEDSLFVVWDVAEGCVKNTFELDSQAIILASSLLGQDKLAALTDEGRLVLVQLSDGRVLQELNLQVGPVAKIVQDPNQPVVVVASKSEYAAFECDRLASLFRTRIQAPAILDITIAKDSGFISAVCLDHILHVFDTKSRSHVVLETDHANRFTCITSLDRCRVAAGKADVNAFQDIIEVWDLRLEQKIASLIGIEGRVDSLDFSRRQRILAAGTGDGRLALWDLN